MHNCCRRRGEAPSSAAASGAEMNGGGSDGEVGSGEEGVRNGRWRGGSDGGGRGLLLQRVRDEGSVGSIGGVERWS